MNILVGDNFRHFFENMKKSLLFQMTKFVADKVAW